jgi:hypothetical protein
VPAMDAIDHAPPGAAGERTRAQELSAQDVLSAQEYQISRLDSPSAASCARRSRPRPCR